MTMFVIGVVMGIGVAIFLEINYTFSIKLIEEQIRRGLIKAEDVAEQYEDKKKNRKRTRIFLGLMTIILVGLFL